MSVLLFIIQDPWLPLFFSKASVNECFPDKSKAAAQYLVVKALFSCGFGVSMD